VFSKLKDKVIGAYVGGQGVGSPVVTVFWSYSNAHDHVVEKKI